MSVPERYPYLPLLRPAQVATGLLCLCILADVVALVIEIDYYSVLGELERGVDLSFDEIAAAEDRSALGAIGQLLAYVLATIAFIVWFRRAYRNTAGLGATGMRYKPGWSIGGWFVPILAFFRPKQISNDIWRASDPDLPRSASGWQGNPVHGLIHWWWGLWIVAGLVSNVWAAVDSSAETLPEQLGASAFAAVSHVVFIVAAVLAILVVRAITIRQEEREEMLRTPVPQAPPSAPPALPEPQPMLPA